MQEADYTMSMDDAGTGRSWHYMRFCGICGARPAELLPEDKPRCRLHGGRALRDGERLPSKPRSGMAWRGKRV